MARSGFSSTRSGPSSCPGGRVKAIDRPPIPPLQTLPRMRGRVWVEAGPDRTTRRQPMTTKKYETIKVEKENGITWVIFNRPDKRNAMSPQLHLEMDDVLDDLAV